MIGSLFTSSVVFYQYLNSVELIEHLKYCKSNIFVPVSHTNNKYIVELLHSVNLTQELIHHSVMYCDATAATTSLFTNRIYLIKDYHVQATGKCSISLSSNTATRTL